MTTLELSPEDMNTWKRYKVFSRGKSLFEAQLGNQSHPRQLKQTTTA